MQRRPAQALLIDLDGVVRRWDPEPIAAVEAAHGLAPGTLLSTAMRWDLYQPAMSGRLTHAQWTAVIAERLPLPPAEATAAVKAFYRPEVASARVMCEEIGSSASPVSSRKRSQTGPRRASAGR